MLCSSREFSVRPLNETPTKQNMNYDDYRSKPVTTRPEKEKREGRKRNKEKREEKKVQK